MTFIRNHQKSDHINFVEVLDTFPPNWMECKTTKYDASPTENYIAHVSLFSFDILF